MRASRLSPKSLTRSAVVAGLAAFAVATPAVNAAVIPARASYGSVVIVADSGHDLGMGSGTIVSRFGNEIRILTARHVAVYGTLTLRLGVGGQAVPAHIVSLDSAHDLAVIDAHVDSETAANLRVAPIAPARSNESVHVWGSGVGGPAFEAASVSTVGGALPDGPARGRIGIDCSSCHQGDSGGGVFDDAGNLIGVYVGFFTLDSGRVSVVEIPDEAARVSLMTPPNPSTVANIDRTNTSLAPATSVASGASRSRTSIRNTESTSATSAVASGSTPRIDTDPDSDSRSK